MTKEEFLNYDKEYVFCDMCNKEVSKYSVSYSKIRLNGTTRKCNICDWIDRHNGFPDIEGFTDDQKLYALEFLLTNKSEFINDLAYELNISIDQVLNLVRGLKVGNKHYCVKCNCSNCGKEVIEELSVYTKNKNIYCSKQCYWNHKPNTIGHGENNSQYERILVQCTNCNKDLLRIRSKLMIKNKYGENHNFCSRKCYSEFRSKYYVGEKASMYHKPMSIEHMNKLKENSAKRIKDRDQINSKIQLKVNEILDRNLIKYSREHTIKYYSIDNYLLDSELYIEVMGNYWHATPLRYNENKYMLNKTQQKGLRNDKAKHTYVKEHFNKEILYLWESDIEKNLDMCEKLILKYIECKGILENYHSFNWELSGDQLCLRNNIIIPYQDMKFDEYKYLMKAS